MDVEVRELLEEAKKGNELLHRQLAAARVAAALLAVLLVAVVVCLGSTMRSLGQVSRILGSADLAALVDTVAGLDVETLNEAIATLEDKMAQLDVQEFNEAAAKLNSAVGALQGAADAVKSWGESVSGGLAGLFGQ